MKIALAERKNVHGMENVTNAEIIMPSPNASGLLLVKKIKGIKPAETWFDKEVSCRKGNTNF